MPMQRKATRWTTALAALALGTAALAQQDPQFTQYMFNMLAINPGYAGSAERVSLKALTRHQWVGFEGAPTTQTLTVHSPLPTESLALGGTLIRDSYGPVTQYGFNVDFAYRLFVGEQSKLSFGLRGGLNLLQGDFAALRTIDPNDQVYAANVNSKTDPQFGFGVLWYSDRHYLGLSMPKLLRTDFFDEGAAGADTLAGSPFQAGQRGHVFFSGGYVFDLGTYVKFKPSFLVKGVKGAPFSFDLNANFLFYEKFWLGAMYRHEDAVGAMAQYYITNEFTVGYSYDYPISALNNYSGGSHEIMIGFEFGNKLKGIRSPRYF
jgi:type IX secretion system PorP/SprF family membrane protein